MEKSKMNKQQKDALKMLQKMWGIKRRPNLHEIKLFFLRIRDRLFPRQLILGIGGKQYKLINPTVKSFELCFDKGSSNSAHFNVVFNYEKAIKEDKE